jgi:hypothetical protein
MKYEHSNIFWKIVEPSVSLRNKYYLLQPINDQTQFTNQMASKYKEQIVKLPTTI